mgnify:CR=1 FL=1
MATGDIESRPKGGWAEYHNGAHVKPSLHGKRKGELMGKVKAFGTGPYADGPFRYRAIEQDVRHTSDEPRLVELRRDGAR